MSEQEYAEFEAAKNYALDVYFNARAKIRRTKANELIFEAGFRLAWSNQRIAINEF